MQYFFFLYFMIFYFILKGFWLSKWEHKGEIILWESGENFQASLWIIVF